MRPKKELRLLLRIQSRLRSDQRSIYTNSSALILGWFILVLLLLFSLRLFGDGRNDYILMFISGALGACVGVIVFCRQAELAWPTVRSLYSLEAVDQRIAELNEQLQDGK